MWHTNCPVKRLSPARARGFSLIEAMVATMIIAFGIVGLMLLMSSATRLNAEGNRLSTAVLLAEELRAHTDNAPFADLSTYDGQTFSALDAAGDPVPDLQQYQQTLTVTPVNPVDLSVDAGADPAAFLLKVAVSHAGSELTQLTWLRTR